MTTPLPVSPTPYITPSLLRRYPTGISWASIPPGRNATDQDRLAIQSDICTAATALVDKCCKQPLRATTDTLLLTGPGTRVGVREEGPAKLILKRWPVLDVVSVQVSRNRLPYCWTPVPASAIGIASPVSGLYGSVVPTAAGEGGQAIYVSKEYVNLRYGPNGLAILVQYANGSPHGGLVSLVQNGATELQVDDCTGWAVTSQLTGYTGATGTVYDSGSQEVIQVTAASAASGPGTLTLASPLQYGHGAGTMVSALPQTVVWAAALYCVSVALERGATSTTVQEIPGKGIAEQAGVKGPGGPAAWAEAILKGTFDRII
jgi:hypothetical protein